MLTASPSMDLFVVPTVSFRLLYGVLILQHARRELLWLGATAHPTAEWIAQQLVEAFGWREPPRYVVRDRDFIYGARFTQRVRAMGIRDRPTAARSRWQNGYGERLIGSIRRECLDHVIVFGERHLRTLLRCYQNITMNVERTCRWTKMRRFRVQFRSAATLPPTLFLADYIISIAGFEFSTGTADGGQAPFKTKLAGCSLNSIMATAVLVLVAWTVVSHAQTGDAASQAASIQQQKSAPTTEGAPSSEGLSDLDAMTFSCVRAGLNAAAREAAKVHSEGTYQFSYFKIINDTHHSFYEVHFKSNYSGEPALKYCVAIYCQQGWDPKTTQVSVRPVSNERQRVQVAAHGGDECGNEQMPVKRRRKR
jgi:hypothetical protein